MGIILTSERDRFGRMAGVSSYTIIVFVFIISFTGALQVRNTGVGLFRSSLASRNVLFGRTDASSSTMVRQGSTSASETVTTSTFLGDMKTKSSIISGSLVSAFAKLGRLVNPTIIGGALSGGLHAITGPDHIAALLPASVGESASRGMKIGAWWGLGHGMTAMFLGLGAFYLKGQIGGSVAFFEKLSSVAEWAVGLSLLLIGGIGVRDSISEDEANTDGHGDGVEEQRVSALKSYRAIFVNGLLHGCSLDGAPSLAPALVLTTWRSVISFLLAYCFGTMAAMSLAAGAVAEGTIRLGEAIGSSKLPKQLSFGSSILAILIGIYWIITAATG